MKRNRKRLVHANMAPRRWVIVPLLVAGFALGHVRLDSRCGTLSDRIRALETEKEELTFKFRREQNHWGMMTSSEQIDLALNRHGLNMLLPRGEQVVRLQLPPAGGDYRPRNQFANR
mgnify:CR=1 FL=1